ncbi:MAG: zinc transporter ZntB [Francisellaceae bacterium]
MSNAKDKIRIYRLDRKGKTEILPADIDIKNHSDELLWLQLHLDGAKSYLKKNKLVPDYAIEILSAKETRPRAIVHDNTLIATFRGVNLNVGADPEDMVAIRVWLQENLIITVSKRKMLSLEDIEEHLKKGTGPMDSGDFIEQLLSFITDKSVDVCTEVDDEIDAIEDQSINNLKSTYDNFHGLSILRRRVIMLKRYLLPQREAIMRIQFEKLSWLDQSNLVHLREIADANIRVLEDLDALRDRISVIHEESFALSQDQLNKKMFILAIVSVIFLPLGFITGLLGINVGGIPGASSKFAFYLVCGLLALFILFQIWLMKKFRIL